MSYNITTTAAAPSGGGGESGPTKCDHIPGLMSRESARKFHDFFVWYAGIYGYVASTICVVGTIATSTAIFVLTRKNMTFNGSILLIWLAVMELIKHLMYVPFAVNSYIVESPSRFGAPFSSPSEGWIIYYRYFVGVGGHFCHNNLIGLTISLAVFRFIYIWFPNKARIYCSPFRNKMAVVLVILCNVCISGLSVYVYTYKLHDVDSMQPRESANQSGVFETLNETTTERTTASSGTKLYVIGYRKVHKSVLQLHNLVFSVLLRFIPCFLLVVLTIMLLAAMSRTFRIRQRDERQITNMLVAVVILFTFTESTNATFIILGNFVPCFYEQVYNKLGDVLDTLSLSTTIVNCSLYVSMGRQFRRTFLELFCPASVIGSRPRWMRVSTRMSSRSHRKSSRKPTETGASSQPRDLLEHYVPDHDKTDTKSFVSQVTEDIFSTNV